MDKYITGAMIRSLREAQGLTQAELAARLFISDKTVSKWETGKGYPDISLLEPIAQVFGISVAELLAGSAVKNTNISANMLRSKFYICPVCGNILHSMGQAQISCHGITLPPLEAEPSEEEHLISVEPVEDELYVTAAHDMTKKHFISFFAAVSPDRLQIVKLYPEGPAAARFKMNSVDTIYCCCNRDGLFVKKLR